MRSDVTFTGAGPRENFLAGWLARSGVRQGGRLLAFALAILLAGSARAQDKPRSVYDATLASFDAAQLIKPREDARLGRAFALAPLLMQEVRGTNAPSAVPTRVFFAPGSVTLQGRTHPQMTYWWFYNADDGAAPDGPQRRAPKFKGGSGLLQSGGRSSSKPPAKTAAAGVGSLRVQGVRLTLNTNGVPVIYEVLGHGGMLEQIYVTQSIEAQASSEFGYVLPGRRFAAERSLAEAPDVVVPRVLDDPPAVMGPIIYLRAGSHAVATVICRCMDVQARTLAGQAFYKLVPGDFSGNVPRATRPEAALPRWLRDDFSTQTNRLTRSLRLPSGF